MQLLIFVITFSMAVSAHAFEKEKLYKGETGVEVSIESMLDQVTLGSVVIVSELHGLIPHHEHQVQVIEGLLKRGHTVNVAMEFVDYLQQEHLDSYLAGNLTDKEFQAAVQWGKIPFKYYKRQINGPLSGGGWTYGVNAPRSLSSKIAKGDFGKLNKYEKSLLPPNFTLGNDIYLARFKEAMGGHVDPEKLMNYFTAQSLWDETSAWKILQKMNQNPNQVMVVIFGDFHNAYGGGLPDRLKARGMQNVISISQVDVADNTQAEMSSQIMPHAQYGKRGHYVWTADSNDYPESRGLYSPISVFDLDFL